MPRDGSGTYTYPPGTPGIPDTTIESAKYNGYISDIQQDLNLPRPIVAGGTGATNATAARANLKVEASTIAVTNYDSHTFEAGSFFSAPGATGAPEASATYLGIAYGDMTSVMFLEARSVITGNQYVRKRTAGAWSAWTDITFDADARYVNVTGDTMTGDLVISKLTPALMLTKPEAGDALVLGQSTVLGVTSRRWGIAFGDTTPETGANAGSNFAIYRFNDTGVYQNTPLAINRATGLITIASDPTSATGVATKQYVDNTTVSIAGDTMTGNLVIGKNNPRIDLDRTTVAGGGSNIFGLVASSPRWHMALGSAAAETGGDAGSDFNITRYSDGAVSLGAAITITRATGNVTLPSELLVQGNTQLNHAGGALPVTAAKLKIVSPNNANAGIAIRNVQDSAYALAFENTVGTLIGNIFTTGAATAFNTSSDAALKEDLKSFDAGNIIDGTMVYDFKWKSTGERAYGVIAQQANEVYPTAVTHTQAVKEKGAERDEWWGVDYSKYVPVLLQELKSLRGRVAELEARLEGKPA